MGNLLNLKKGFSDPTDLKDVTATAAELNQLDGTTLTAGLGLVKVTETAAFGDFTDNEDTTGTFEFSTDIPIGATFIGAAITAVVGFAGDTTAVITIGDGTDVDRYNAGTPNVFATAANGVAAGVPSGVLYHAAAKTPTLIVTVATDFTAVSAGSVTIELFYWT